MDYWVVDQLLLQAKLIFQTALTLHATTKINHDTQTRCALIHKNSIIGLQLIEKLPLMPSLRQTIFTESYTLYIDTKTRYIPRAHYYNSKTTRTIQESVLCVCDHAGQGVEEA